MHLGGFEDKTESTLKSRKQVHSFLQLSYLPKFDYVLKSESSEYIISVLLMTPTSAMSPKA